MVLPSRQTGPHSFQCKWTLTKHTMDLGVWWLIATLSKGSCYSSLTAYSSSPVPQLLIPAISFYLESHSPISFILLLTFCLFVVLKLALPFLESQISMPCLRTRGFVHWWLSRQKSLSQQNVLNTYYVLGSVLCPADTMNESGKISALIT